MDRYDQFRMCIVFSATIGRRRWQSKTLPTATSTQLTHKTIIGMLQKMKRAYIGSKLFEHWLSAHCLSLSLQREQLASHESKVVQLEESLEEHKRGPVPTKGLPLQNYIEKESYLQYEVE